MPIVADERLEAENPFTLADAIAVGISRDMLGRLTREGLVRRVTRGIYVDATVPDSLQLRAAALALVVPESAVVTDRTAAWLHGVDILSPGDHLLLPPVSIVQPVGGSRVRRGESAGRERGLSAHDIETVNGVRVTTPLRTAVDLGRLLRRDAAIGALDVLLRHGTFDQEQLLDELGRFRGYRGIVQLRALAPLADGRAESPRESVLRLRWLDAGLPPPEPQVTVIDGWGRVIYRIDVGVKELRYGAEYDGVDFHTTPEQQEHDRRRRDELRREHNWLIDVFGRGDLSGPEQQVMGRLRAGVRRAQAPRLRRPA